MSSASRNDDSIDNDNDNNDNNYELHHSCVQIMTNFVTAILHARGCYGKDLSHRLRIKIDASL